MPQPSMHQPSSFRNTSRARRQLPRKRLAVGPHRPLGKRLLLPDRHRLLQRVDQPPARLERRSPVRGRHHDQHARLAHHQAAQPMNRRHIPHPKSLHRLRAQPLHLLQPHLAVRLVVQIQRLPPARIVAHNAVEHAHCAVAARLHRRDNRLRRNRSIHNLNQHRPCSRSWHNPPLTGGNRATSSPSRSTIDVGPYSRLTATARLRHNCSFEPAFDWLSIEGLDVRQRKSSNSSPTVAPSASSATSSEAPNRSRSTPKYNTLTRTRSGYLPESASAPTFPTCLIAIDIRHTIASLRDNLTMISTKAYSELLATLYAAPLDEPQWQIFLRSEEHTS